MPTSTTHPQQLPAIDLDLDDPATKADGTGAEADSSRRRRGVARLGRRAADRVTLAVREYGLIAAAGLTALAVLAALLWLLTALIGALADGLGATGGALTTFADWLSDGPVTRSVAGPVRAYLDAHATGLPATGRDLWIVWLVAVAVLYTGALAGSKFARIGWAVIGVLTAAAAYAGAGHDSGPAAAGLTAAVWLLLSLPAYTRPGGALTDEIARHLADRRGRRDRERLDAARGAAVARAAQRRRQTVEIEI